jgi:short-subunit dehydrogenase
VAAAARAAGPVDLLVNNAGASVGGPVEATPAGVALGLFDTNVIGPLRLMAAFLPGMRERGGGTVANLSSVGGQAVFPLNGVSAATKAALEALSETLALEAGQQGIRVLVMQLGGVDTGMYQRQARYASPAYAHLERAQQDAAEEYRAPTTAEQAARAIADVITDPSSPLRVPIGQDAAWLLAERARLDDTAWAARVGELFTQPTAKGGR